MQGLTDLQRSRTNLSVPLSAYLQLSLPGGGNNDKRSAPPASTGSFRHWLNPKFALTLVYLVCLPWGPRGHALLQLGRRRGKGIQYHLAEVSCSLGPCWRTDSLKSSLAACRNTDSTALSEKEKFRRACQPWPALSSLHALAQAVAALRRVLAALQRLFHSSSTFSEKQDRIFVSPSKNEGSSTSPPVLLIPLLFSASKPATSDST